MGERQGGEGAREHRLAMHAKVACGERQGGEGAREHRLAMHAKDQWKAAS